MVSFSLCPELLEASPPPWAAPVASSPLSCEIVYDKPDPEGPGLSSSREVSVQPSGGSSHTPRQLGVSLTGADTGVFLGGL